MEKVFDIFSCKTQNPEVDYFIPCDFRQVECFHDKCMILYLYILSYSCDVTNITSNLIYNYIIYYPA